MTDIGPEGIMAMAIYVLPTEPGLPPRAVIGQPVEGTIQGAVAVWSGDVGSWTLHGELLPSELSDAITEHAKSLGVEW